MILNNYPKAIQNNLMNILGTHDTMRALTYLGMNIEDNMDTSSRYVLDDEERKKGKQLLKIASLIQYTVMGIPTVFYGDEAGMEGTKDPYCRAPYPWGKEDGDLIEWYKKLGKLRKKQVFDGGDFCLLYAKDEKGKDIYRFHLKSLALSNIPYFELPLKEELNFILRKVYSNKVYMDVIFESVYTVNWFNAIWGIIDSNGGWKKLSKEYKEKTMVMCQRTLLFDAEVVLDKLDSVLDYGDENDCKHLQSLLQYNNLNCESNKLVTFYNKLVKKRNPLEYINLLRNILNGNPTFVCNELKENIKLQLKEEYSYKIIVPHDVGHLYEELLNNYHELAIQLLVDILNIVYEETQIKLKGFDIYSSTKFFSFQRTTGGHFISNFVWCIILPDPGNAILGIQSEEVSSR